jgi:hypothetical protein
LLVPLRAHAQAEELPAPPAEAPATASAPAPFAEPQKPAPELVPAPTDPSRSHGILLLPSLGFSVPVGSTSQAYSESYRLGALVGCHLSRRFSLNGELNIEAVDADTDASFWRPHELMVDLTASPLVHLRSSQVVVGPKVGWFGDTRSDSGLSGHGQGLVLGLNAGLFLPWHGVLVGGLVSAVVRHFISFTCNGDPSTADTSCNNSGYGYYTSRSSNVETVDFSAALLY